MIIERDLRVYMQHTGGRLSHYRDSDDLEVDVIIEMEDSSWAAIEVKVGAKQIDDAAKNLLKFAKKIDTARSGEPA
ncbi:MAG: DUF4143 domain-containing protein, partial [Actinobacteria bacterium]|nr:DUF4143 domain-containing protein [Actinomycetota bacterium]